ncbi:MAG: hypothetical protein AAFX40_02365 [Cyanobacteria bacterium J06639_1]
MTVLTSVQPRPDVTVRDRATELRRAFPSSCPLSARWVKRNGKLTCVWQR